MNRSRVLSSVTLLLTDLQIIVHAKGAEYTLRPDTRDVAIHLVRYKTFEPHVTVFHDDVDRRKRLHSITGAERGLAVDRAIDGQTDTVVIQRKRQNFDIVDYLADAFHVPYGVLRVRLDDRFVNLARKNHGI